MDIKQQVNTFFNWTLFAGLSISVLTHSAFANMTGAPIRMDNIDTMNAIQKVNAYCAGPFWLRDTDTRKAWVERLQDGPRPDDANDRPISTDAVKAEYREMGKP